MTGLIGVRPIALDRVALLLHAPAIEIDWNQKMRPPAGRVKVIEHEPKSAGGPLFSTNRPELYEVLRNGPLKRDR